MTQLMSVIDACRSVAIAGSAGATSDCSRANESPPRDRNSTTNVVLACRPERTGRAGASGSCTIVELTADPREVND